MREECCWNQIMINLFPLRYFDRKWYSWLQKVQSFSALYIENCLVLCTLYILTHENCTGITGFWRNLRVSKVSNYIFIIFFTISKLSKLIFVKYFYYSALSLFNLRFWPLFFLFNHLTIPSEGVGLYSTST